MSQARVRFDQPNMSVRPARVVTASWRISRAAMARAKPGIIAPGNASQHALLRITIESTESGWQTVVLLEDPKLQVTHSLEMSAAPVEIVQIGEHTHIEAPGLLSATFNAGRPVFIRTPMFAKLGLPGGRYELESASMR